MIISQHGQPPVRSHTFLDRFDRMAKQTEYLTGHPLAFAAAPGLYPNVGVDRPALRLW
jgi:hypothetical protein